MTIAQRSNANRMISEKGQSVTLTWPIPGAYNTATGAVEGGSTVTVNTAAALLPLQAYRKFDGTDIVAGDETLLLSALNDAGQAYDQPGVNAVVTLADGSKRTLTAINPLRPAGLTIMFDCVVRGNA